MAGHEAEFLMTLGGLLLLGYFINSISDILHVPRVTLLLLAGFLIGPGGLNFLRVESEQWFPIVTDLALAMVGFLIGGQLTWPMLRIHGKQVLWISIWVVMITAAITFLGLWIFGLPIELALILGGVSTSTAPAATWDVVKQCHAHGSFTRTLLGIVAVDDAWGLILFSFCLSMVAVVTGQSGTAQALLDAIRYLGGAFLLGITLGLPAAYLTGRVAPGEPTRMEAMGILFLCGGLALSFDVSFLLTSMTLGVVVTNLARHHKRPFHAIEGIEWPFLLVFFVLAGAGIEFDSFVQIGVIGAAYVMLRILGRLTGAWLGGWFCGAKVETRRWMGLALMPQAGVALGMTLIAVNQFPEMRKTLLPLVVGSTVIFELLGPFTTRWALGQIGDANPEFKSER